MEYDLFYLSNRAWDLVFGVFMLGCVFLFALIPCYFATLLFLEVAERITDRPWVRRAEVRVSTGADSLGEFVLKVCFLLFVAFAAAAVVLRMAARLVGALT